MRALNIYISIYISAKTSREKVKTMFVLASSTAGSIATSLIELLMKILGSEIPRALLSFLIRQILIVLNL